MNFTKYIFPAVLGGFLLCSCPSSTEPSLDDLTSNDIKKNEEEAGVVVVGNRLFSIPSPVQTSILVKESGAEYDISLLNKDISVDKYATKFQKGLNLGIYGADLGYVNLYGQTQDAVNYLNAAKKLSDELGVTSAFSEAFITRFQENLGNTDSLLLIVSDAYQLIDEYLQNNENNDIGGLVLAGGWIEALYFTTEVYKKNPTTELKQRIGEQKFSIENLIKMLNTYANNDIEQYQELVTYLMELQVLYDQVTVRYEYAEPIVDAANKITTIKNKTEVDLTSELVVSISEKVNMIRTSIVQ